MRTIRINTKIPYDVLVGEGILELAGSLLRSLKGTSVAPGKLMIISDEQVAAHYLNRLVDNFRSVGFSVDTHVVSGGEASKSWEELGLVLEHLAQANMTRSDMLVALGGGIVGDLTGLAASLYNRGMRFVQIPTSWLAAVDSSVGGKTAVNLPAGKNLVGTFWQPSMVICDTRCFETLSPEILADGLAESFKYGVLGDPELFQMLQLPHWQVHQEEIIARCITMKAKLVEADERDHGCRQLLNLGHTFGHGIEAVSHFSISHGRAVAMGMVLAAQVAEHLKLTVDVSQMEEAAPVEENQKKKLSLAEQLKEALALRGLSGQSPYTLEELLPYINKDKKRDGDTINLVLPRSIGQCILHTVTREELTSILTSMS